MMGPGFGDAVASAITSLIVVVALLMFLAGAGTVAGCQWLVHRYDLSISVEREPHPPEER